MNKLIVTYSNYIMIKKSSIYKFFPNDLGASRLSMGRTSRWDSLRGEAVSSILRRLEAWSVVQDLELQLPPLGTTTRETADWRDETRGPVEFVGWKRGWWNPCLWPFTGLVVTWNCDVKMSPWITWKATIYKMKESIDSPESHHFGWCPR